MKFIFAALNVSFNCGLYTVIIKRQFLYISYWRRTERYTVGFLNASYDSRWSVSVSWTPDDLAEFYWKPR